MEGGMLKIYPLTSIANTVTILSLSLLYKNSKFHSHESKTNWCTVKL